MARTKKELPPDMWEAARVLWENTHGMTDRDVHDRLVELYPDEAPKNHSSVARRRQKEKWQRKTPLDATENATDATSGNKSSSSRSKQPKNATKKAKKTTEKCNKTDDKSSQNIDDTEQNNKESESATSDDDCNKNCNTGLILWTESEKRIYREVEKLILDNQQKTEVIIKHRKRIRQAGELWETNASLLQALKGLKPDEDGETIKQILVSAESISRTLTALTMSQKVLFEQEMLVCGIKWEDFEMSEQDRRMEGMKALDGIYEEAQRKREELQQAMQRRLPEFENLTLDDAEFGESDYAAVYEDDEDDEGDDYEDDF